MTAPFRITWQEPTEGPLPAGAKVERDTGLVGELLVPAFVRKTNVGWWLTAADIVERFSVDCGGDIQSFAAWTIRAVGLRDDGLLWMEPCGPCELPAGTRFRFMGIERSLLDAATCRVITGGSVRFGLEANQFGKCFRYLSEGREEFYAGCGVSEIGFPRPFPIPVGSESARCDYCGKEAWSIACRDVGGISYTVCANAHLADDAAFLAGALAIRRDGAAFERAITKTKTGPAPTVEWADAPPPVDPASTARECERAATRAAKIAKLSEMLRVPMGARFQEETNWRKR